jgi:hypothetical protein
MKSRSIHSSNLSQAEWQDMEAQFGPESDVLPTKLSAAQDLISFGITPISSDLNKWLSDNL